MTAEPDAPDAPVRSISTHQAEIVAARVDGLTISEQGTLTGGAILVRIYLSDLHVHVNDVWPLLPRNYYYLGTQLQAWGFESVMDAEGHMPAPEDDGERWLRGARASDLARALVGRHARLQIEWCDGRLAQVRSGDLTFHPPPLPAYEEPEPEERLDELLEAIRAGTPDLRRLGTVTEWDESSREAVEIEVELGGLSRAGDADTAADARDRDYTHQRWLCLLVIAESGEGMTWEEVYEELQRRGTPVRQNTVGTRLSELHHEFGWIRPTGKRRRTTSKSANSEAAVYVATSHRAYGSDPHHLYQALRYVIRDKRKRNELEMFRLRGVVAAQEQRDQLRELVTA